MNPAAGRPWRPSWPAGTRRVSGVRLPAGLTATVTALLICALLDLALLVWIRVGPPPGKGDAFFLELVLLLLGSALAVLGALFFPNRARAAVPLLFIVLAWHTGLQISLSTQWPLVVSSFDILVPLILLIGLLERGRPLARYPLGSGPVAARFWRSYRLFAPFLLWGLALGIDRGVDVGGMLMNVRSFALYPAIALIIVWTVRTWRQLYGAVGLMLALMFERALLNNTAQAHSGTKALLANGQLLVRNGGDFASINQFAFYLMSGVLIIIGLMIAGRSLRLRVVLAAPLLIMVIGLAATYSRGAYVATAVGVCVLALCLPRRRAAGLIALTVLMYTAVQVVHPGAATLVSSRLHTFDHSAQERLDYLTLGRDVIVHYPVGAGFGAAFTEGPRGLQPDYRSWPWYHDDYLQLATEVGVLGLLAFAWIWVVVMRLGLRAYRRAAVGAHAGIIVGLMAAITGMLVQAATEQFFWRADIAPHIWIVAGLLLAACTLVHNTDDPSVPAGATGATVPC